VEDKSKCGLVDIQVGEASPYKPITKIGLTIKNGGKYKQNGMGGRRKAR
jgi:hypothetical protein